MENYFRRHRSALLLFSGGLDSSLLLAAAGRVMGRDLLALTFTGPHVVPGELAAAAALARRLGVRHLIREIDPLSVPEFRQNTPRRCYGCKKAVIQAGWKIAVEYNIDVLWDGTNVDDLKDYRPGLEAARELGVASPLLEAGWGKEAIRDWSRRLGLAWDKPAQSCLATRFPYHTVLTREALARVGEAETWLRRRGFMKVRLRVHGDAARLELSPQEWPRFLAPQMRGPFTALLARLGWTGLELA